MKRDYYPANKTAREIQNEIELIRRLTPRKHSLNRRVNRDNPHLRMAVISAITAGLIAVTSYLLAK
jgi:hypothetical protein